MQRNGARLLIAGIAGLAAAHVAHAGEVKMKNNLGANTPGGGGPFTAVLNPGTPDEESIVTFCIESNESFTNNATYDCEIAESAKNGGSGGQIADPDGGFHDPLSNLTAYLYFSMINGNLAADTSFDYDVATPTVNVDDAEILQQLIWWIEQETPGVNPIGAGGLIEEMYDYAVANAPAGIGNVRVLRLYDQGTGANKQDQLIIIPMPAPVAMAAAGLVGLGVIRRRR